MPKRVLVIDDNPDLLRNMCDLLEQSGFYLHCSMTAEDAVQVLDDTAYDAIVTDIFLEHGEGFALVDKARAKNIPTVVISGDPQAVMTARQRGVAALQKPFTLETLLAVLTEQMDARAAESR